MSALQRIALVLTVIGAINWGLIGFFNFNLVEAIFGDTFFERVVYGLVGLAGLINIGLLFLRDEERSRYPEPDRT